MCVSVSVRQLQEVTRHLELSFTNMLFHSMWHILHQTKTETCFFLTINYCWKVFVVTFTYRRQEFETYSSREIEKLRELREQFAENWMCGTTSVTISRTDSPCNIECTCRSTWTQTHTKYCSQCTPKILIICVFY